MIVKRGDTHQIVEKVNADLTGCTVRWLIRLAGTPVEIPAGVLPSTIIDAPNGRVAHQLSGTLPVGDHAYELEITRDGTIQTAPSVGFGRLSVKPDLG